MDHYVPRNSQFLIRGSEGWVGAGWEVFVCILLYLLDITYFLLYFTAFMDPRGGFSRPQNDPKTIPKLSYINPQTIKQLSQNNSKTIRNDPNMSPKCISASAQPHSRPSAHIRPSGGGRRSPRAARCCGAPERERGVFGCFSVFYSIC